MENEVQRIEVNLLFTDIAFKKLNEIKNKANLETIVDTIRNALRLYEWFLDKQKNGYKICIEKDDEYREVKIEF